MAEKVKQYRLPDDPITLDELKSFLWAAATHLRGQIDAAGYKEYIFPLLFFKRISDVYDEQFEGFVCHLPMQKCSKIFPSTISFVTSPAISLRWKMHSRISCETKSPDRFSANPCWTRWMASKAWVKAS